MLKAATSTRIEMTSGTMDCCSATHAKRPRWTSSMGRAKTGGPNVPLIVSAVAAAVRRSARVRSMRVASSGPKRKRLRTSFKSA